jgi:hypothetical protein
MITDHARLAPSSAYRWGPGGCPGSAAMEAQHPEDGDSEESREGTAAHHYLTETLFGRVVAPGSLAPNGYPINLEMIDAATGMLEDVRDTIAAAASNDWTLDIERKLPPSRFVHPENWGTPDVVLTDRTEKALHVWDYKYGHRYVDAFKNWQMMNYAILVLSEILDGDESWNGWRVTLTIAQPRNYAPEGPLREWYLSGSHLRERADELSKTAWVAAGPGADLVTGEHCRDCSAAHACPALQRAVMTMVDVTRRQTSVDMPPAAVGLELRILEAATARIKARRDALEAHAMGMFKRGQNVPGWQVDHVKGRKRWTQPAVEIVAMGQLFGVDLAKPLEACTPVQAEKKGVDGSVIAAYSESPSGAAKLVSIDDATAARVFGDGP